MEVVRTHNGTRIYSAEKLLVDIEKHLDRVPGGKRIVITPALALEESIE